MSKREAYLNFTSYSLGERRQDLHQSFKSGHVVNDVQSYIDAGFYSHHISEGSVYDIAKKTLTPLKDKLDGTDLILYATCLTLNGNIGKEADFQKTKDVKFLMDYPASHLQADFNLEKASVIGLNQQACTSVIGALRVGSAMITQDEAVNKVLCITADRFPPGAIYEQTYNLISDGGSACILSTEPIGYKILKAVAITNGALAQANDEEAVGSYFSYTVQLMQELLEKNKLQWKDIDWLVTQNMNINAWKILSRLVGVDYEKVYFGSIKEVGHIISSDNIVNLEWLQKEGRIKSGQKVVLFMAGFGLNWQAIILEKV